MAAMPEDTLNSAPPLPAWRQEYPFESHFFELSPGRRLHYLDEGEGQPLVMLHGNPTWSFHYRRLVKLFRGQGRRCLVPDHLGCGLSDKPQDYPYRLQNHIDNLTGWLKQLDLATPFDLLVHDWGGAIGMGYAVRFPQKIRRIAILNSAAFLSDQCPWRIRVCRPRPLGSLLIRLGNGFARGALRMALHAPARLTPEVRQGYLAPYDSYRNRIATLRFVQDIPLSPTHPTWGTIEAIEDNLKRLAEKPIFLGWGMRDFCFTPHFLGRWLEFFPKAEVHRFEPAGHYVLEEAFAELAPLLGRFFCVPNGFLET